MGENDSFHQPWKGFLLELKNFSLKIILKNLKNFCQKKVSIWMRNGVKFRKFWVAMWDFVPLPKGKRKFFCQDKKIRFCSKNERPS